MVARDEDEFSEWYRDQHRRVVASLMAVSGLVDAATEAADEAFARAFLAWDRISTTGQPDAWVFRVALNHLRRQMRRSGLERRFWSSQPTQAAPSPELPDSSVWQAVRTLPLRQRTALVLRYVADLPEAEIARAMGIRRGTVAATLAAARERVATELSRTESEEAVRHG